MNTPEANAELARPLVMGDERQILAKRFLEDVTRAHQRLLSCRRCKGDGVIFAKRSRSNEQCECVRRYPRDVIEACGIGYVASDEESTARKRRAKMGNAA